MVNPRLNQVLSLCGGISCYMKLSMYIMTTYTLLHISNVNIILPAILCYISFDLAYYYITTSYPSLILEAAINNTFLFVMRSTHLFPSEMLYNCYVLSVLEMPFPWVSFYHFCNEKAKSNKCIVYMFPTIMLLTKLVWGVTVTFSPYLQQYKLHTMIMVQSRTNAVSRAIGRGCGSCWCFNTIYNLFKTIYTYIVACQGGGVSSKIRRRGTDKTWSLNPLVH